MMRTLVVCEKPDAASRVARALDENGQPSKEQLYGVPYYECDTRSGEVVVCSALGHLYTLDAKGKPPRRFYPVWRSEEHTSELQSQSNLVCRLLLEKKKQEVD